LAELIEDGPEKSGFIGNCWRSPMIQEPIPERFNVLDSVHYISQLLKNMVFTYQKAKFVSDHLNEEKRAQWLAKTCPEALAKENNAYLNFSWIVPRAISWRNSSSKGRILTAQTCSGLLHRPERP
jgi:hypothetical protein